MTFDDSKDADGWDIYMTHKKDDRARARLYIGRVWKNDLKRVTKAS